MGGNAIQISRDVNFSEAQLTVNWIKDELLPKLKIPSDHIRILGSYGKKLESELYGDIDIALLAEFDSEAHPKSIEMEILNLKLEEMGFTSKINYGFGIVSFGCPIGGNSNECVQVDFMFTPNLEWSEFIYNSPNFRNKESKYKGLFRNILLMAIITETQKIITKSSELGIEEIDVNILRYPKGIFRVKKSFMGKKGLVKNGKNVVGFDDFITNDPQEVTNITIGENFKPVDMDTFEKLWEIVVSPNFKWINKREGIIERYVECLKEQSLMIPEEVIKRNS